MTTPSFVAVLPAIDPAATRACVESMAAEVRQRLLLIDNSTARLCDLLRHPTTPGYRWCVPYDGENLGVPASWNLGVTAALDTDADWLLILSTSIRFGDEGGRDLLDMLATTSEPYVVGTQHGWKCIALSRGLLTRVGRFDPVFSPAYREDTDYLVRMARAGLPSPRENGGRLTQFTVDARSTGDGRTVTSGLVHMDWDANLRAYVRKWGGDQGDERYQHPYNDPTLDHTFVGEYDPARA